MARPKKQTVDYFPHIANSGKTIFILENQFGNDGYAFWFKTLELLATTDGHVIDTGNPSEWEFLIAKTLVSEDTAREILNLLGKLEAIDNELLQVGILWCQNLVDNVSDVYKKRKVNLPVRPDPNSFGQQKHESKPVSDGGNTSSVGVMDNINPQSKVKETKVKETKVKDSSNGNKNDEENTATTTNVHRFFQENIGMENMIVGQMLEEWIKDIGEPLVMEALERTAKAERPSFKLAEWIMKDFMQKNIKMVEAAKAEEAARQRSAMKKSFVPKKENLPDWANEPDKPGVETMLDLEQQQYLQERIARLKSSQKREEAE